MRISQRIPTVLIAWLLAPATLTGQGAAGELDTYFRGVGEYYRVPPEEVSILSEWSLGPEEIPVLLFLSRSAGVSADALVALKRGGQSWFGLGARYGVGAGAFYVPLPASADAGSLASAYGKFRSSPEGSWDALTLDDREVVGLVNLRFISEHLRVPPSRVLESARSGSYVQAYSSLRRRAP